MPSRAINAAGVPTSIRRGRFFFCSLQHETRRNTTVALHSPAQLHSYRGRRGENMCLGADSRCLAIGPVLNGTDQRSARVGKPQSEPTFAIATDAVCSPTTPTSQPGGVAERFSAPVFNEAGTHSHTGQEGSNPSSTTEHLNNHTVVQRRSAGQRSHNRPAPPSPHAFPQHAAVGRWLRGCSRSWSS